MITKVFILYTGGTIGMGPKDKDDPYSPLEPKPLEQLLTYVPGFDMEKEPKKYRSIEAKKLYENNKKGRKRTPFIELDNGNIIIFGSTAFEKPVDSSDIGPKDWKMMAKIIEKNYDVYDGYVILHGTDTMAFTSSALSFMFGNLAKPVVITGSQLPISGLRTDAVLNLINAIYIAGYKATDLPPIPEVVIAFADKIIRGCRATKISTSDWAGFDSPNFPLLGTIGEHIKINTNYVMDKPTRKFFTTTEFDDHVFIIGLFPGFSNSQIEKLLTDETIRGYIIRTYGTGNVPSNKKFLNSIKKAVKKHKMVVNLSQCTVGTVEMGLYEASSILMERGVLSGLDMTPEAAVTKLMWTLGTQYGKGKDYTQMQINQRGEQTDNLFDFRFGGVKKSKAVSIFTSVFTPDQRFNITRISDSMLRISNLGIKDVEIGKRIKIHVFMNMPTANHKTNLKEERHITTIDFEWTGKPESRMQNITYKTQNVISKGDIIITLVTESEDMKIYFKGLYIAIYSKA